MSDRDGYTRIILVRNGDERPENFTSREFYSDTATDRVRCPGCGRATCSNPRLECGGESTTAV